MPEVNELHFFDRHYEKVLDYRCAYFWTVNDEEANSEAVADGDRNLTLASDRRLWQA